MRNKRVELSSDTVFGVFFLKEYVTMQCPSFNGVIITEKATANIVISNKVTLAYITI